MGNPLSDLNELLRSLQPERIPGAYAFVSVPDREALGTADVIATIREPEGLSAVIAESDAARLTLPILFRAAWITLTVQSDLQAVRLTAARPPPRGNARTPLQLLGPAWHDHLFVPLERVDEAMRALQRLQRDTGASVETEP